MGDFSNHDSIRRALEGAERVMPDWMAEQPVILLGNLRRGTAAQATDAVQALTGREPRSFAEFARDHARLFGS